MRVCVHCACGVCVWTMLCITKLRTTRLWGKKRICVCVRVTQPRVTTLCVCVSVCYALVCDGCVPGIHVTVLCATKLCVGNLLACVCVCVCVSAFGGETSEQN